MSKGVDSEMTPEVKKDPARTREDFQIAIRNGSIRLE